jgi:hypothetical protein
MTDSSDWFRRVYERHLDLLLAEELECRPSFAGWLLKRGVLHGNAPHSDPVSCVVTVSNVDPMVDPAAAGEDDLLAQIRWEDGTIGRLLIEDKLDAVLQPRQLERYALRAEVHRGAVDVVGAIVVAPRSYLSVNDQQLSGLGAVAVEEIVEEFQQAAEHEHPDVAARLQWRARRLITFKAAARVAAPDNLATIATRDWLVERLAVADELIGPQMNSMRTINTTWLYFNAPTGLIYKIDHGFVDLYLRDIWPHDEARQRAVHDEGAGPPGFSADHDSKGNLLLRRVVHPPVRPSEVDLTSEDAVMLSLGVSACADAAAWVRSVADS